MTLQTNKVTEHHSLHSNQHSTLNCPIQLPQVCLDTSKMNPQIWLRKQQGNVYFFSLNSGLHNTVKSSVRTHPGNYSRVHFLNLCGAECKQRPKIMADNKVGIFVHHLETLSIFPRMARVLNMANAVMPLCLQVLSL